MSSILYYITGHGYGHAVRSHQVIRALKSARPNLQIHVRTTAPEWLFGNPPGTVSYTRHAIDIGVLQTDSLEMDLAATLQRCEELQAQAANIIDRELAFIKANDIRLIVGDVPPLCFKIATRAGLPSVSIANFTWDVIYQSYVSSYPGFRQIAHRMRDYYGKATLALSLPYPCDMSMFPRHEPIPWISRLSLLTKQQARKKFNLPQTATMVLVSFGGLGLRRFPWQRLEKLRDYFFIATGESYERYHNRLVLPDAQNQYEDLIRAVDVIVTKPGYGIVADVLAHRLPILYTDRGDFPEYPRLAAALRECATAAYIPQTELLSGNIDPFLAQLLSGASIWPSVDLNGAHVSAKRLLTLLDDHS